MELLYATRVNHAAAGLYAAPTPTVTLPGGGANVRINSTAHGLSTGNSVVVSGTTGVTGLNAIWPVNVLSANQFELVGSSALTGTPAGTAAVALPDLDISGLTGDWVIRIRAYGTGVVSLEDTVNNWSASERRHTIPVRAADEGQEFIISSRTWSGASRFGVSSAKMRLRLVSGTNVVLSMFVNTNG